MRAILKRIPSIDNCTIGLMTIYDNKNFIEFECITLELPDRLNAKRISRIPSGIYTVRKYSSAKFPKTFEILNVKDRSNILIHTGNTTNDTLGCILVGSHIATHYEQPQTRIINSRDTLKELNLILPKEFYLTII